MADDVRFCVVCGNGSHRKDWVNKSGNFVACDHHTKDEFSKALTEAVKKTEAPPAATSKTPAPAAS
jgi:hypothetical protein